MAYLIKNALRVLNQAAEFAIVLIWFTNIKKDKFTFDELFKGNRITCEIAW